MSGIAGIIDFDNAPLDRQWIAAMTSAMAVRGPDGINHWSGNAALLGHCLLCTTEESLAEQQPLVSDRTGAVLVMDGRLDNWQELRQELTRRRAPLRDRTDAELVLRAYELWGRDCLCYLEGDFAFAIWDAAHQRIFCGRDPMGGKPFNYHWNGTRLTFASELQAIAAMPWVPQTLNHGTLAEYLSMEWLSLQETPWTGIERLPAAHWLEIEAGRVRIGRYWEPDLDAAIVYRRDEDYVEHYRELLTDIVRRTSRTHRPLSCEVSGGLDSSAVFAVAAGLHRESALPAPGVTGYTLLFDDDSAADELTYARTVAAHIGTPVLEVKPTRQPLTWYETWARTYREFPGYPNGIMGWGIREAARTSGSRALLVGGGGDEWLSGSRDYYVEELTSGRWRHFAESLVTDLRENGLRETARWVRRAGAIAALPAPLLHRIRALRARRRRTAQDRAGWLTPPLEALFMQRAQCGVPVPDDRAFPRAGQASLHRTLYAPYGALAHEAEERLAASLGMELRRPFATPAMVQFAFSTPERLRVRGRICKRLHRQAIQPLLPSTIVDRNSKADFMSTFRWHTTEVRGFLTEKRTTVKDWIQQPELDAALERFGGPTSNGVAEWKLWSLMGWAFLQDGVRK